MSDHSEDEKAPLCKILRPAPWQESSKTIGEESSGWEREEHETDELSTEELMELVWSIEESKTPLDDSSAAIAEEMSEAEDD